MTESDPPQDREEDGAPPPPPPPPPGGPWTAPHASTYGTDAQPPPPPWPQQGPQGGQSPPPPPPPWQQQPPPTWPQQAPPGWPQQAPPGWQQQAPQGWQQQGPPGWQQQGYGPGFGRPVSNPSATAALVLGIVGIVTFWALGLGILLGILAVVFGAIGMSRSNQLPERFQRGRARAGIITGVAAIVLGIGFLVAAIIAFDDVNSDPADGFCDDDRFIQDPDC